MYLWGTFSHASFDKIVMLSKPWHRTRVTKDMRADTDWWWIHYLHVFNGLTPMVECRPAAPVCIDACNSGTGAYYDGECLLPPWSAWPEAASLHINFKEVFSLEPAVTCWSPRWQNKKIFVHTDIQAAAAIINKTMCKNKIVMQSLRRIFCCSAVYNVLLHCTSCLLPRNIQCGCRLGVTPGRARSHDQVKQCFK